MQEKKCFKCGRILPLSEFYKHSQMGDGHLNKCKECTKKDVKERYDINSDNKEWMEKERERGRRKYHKLDYLHKFQDKTRMICPVNGNISRMLRRKGYETKGKEAHHWNYNFPFSVILLSKKAHKRIHQHLSSPIEKVFYSDGGMRIDTEEQAIFYYRNILNSYCMSEPLEVINLK
jgi:hypothetical protein